MVEREFEGQDYIVCDMCGSDAEEYTEMEVNPLFEFRGDYFENVSGLGYVLPVKHLRTGEAYVLNNDGKVHICKECVLEKFVADVDINNFKIDENHG